MKLVFFEDQTAANFHPLSLNRPVYTLKSGWRTLAQKVRDQVHHDAVAYFCRDYLTDTFRRDADGPVNEASRLAGGDLLLVNGRLIASGLSLPTDGESHIGMAGESIAYLWIREKDLSTCQTETIEALIASARNRFPEKDTDARLATYVWDLMLANATELIADFKAAGHSGVYGTIEQPQAIRGDADNVFVAETAVIHPFVCIDAEHGPVYIDEGVILHPFTRIEGPAYIGPNSVVLGAKIREGCTIGPTCRVGGEVEEAILHGLSNKYHDGFLGHAYVGEWVNLGALTTNSDLKNDYTTVEVRLDGRTIDTGSTKVGAMIGDHVKTGIGTLFNTGTVVGPMSILMSTGSVLPKSIPSFSWFVGGVVTKGFGRKKLYETAKIAMSRRGRVWTDADRDLWEAIYEHTAEERNEAIKRGRRKLRTSQQ